MNFLRFLRPTSILLKMSHIANVRQMSSSKYDGVAAKDKQEFKDSFPRYVQEMMSLQTEEYEKPFYDHFKQFLEYIMPHGKLFRGNSVSHSYRYLLPDQTLSPDEIFRYQLLGWFCEHVMKPVLNLRLSSNTNRHLHDTQVHTGIIVIDDIVDNSPMRRRRKTWHNVEGIGMIAINDASILYLATIKLLQKHFKNSPYYVDLLEFFNEYIWQVFIGQTTDALVSVKYKATADLEAFTMDNYLNLARHKTSTTTHFPMELMLRVNGLADPETLAKLKDITDPAGQLFQMQNDGVDLFGVLNDNGKPSTDVSQGACTWFIVTALQQANQPMIKVLKDNYGKPDPECTQRVIEVFRKLNLAEQYEQSTKLLYDSIIKRTEDPSYKIPPKLAEYYINLYYRPKIPCV